MLILNGIEILYTNVFSTLHPIEATISVSLIKSLLMECPLFRSFLPHVRYSTIRVKYFLMFCPILTINTTFQLRFAESEAGPMQPVMLSLNFTFDENFKNTAAENTHLTSKSI